MRRIFLDVGAFDGSSVRFFRTNYAKADQFEIFCFESLPANIKLLKKVDNISIVPFAAWSSAGEIDMFLGKTKSGSMYSDKTTGRVDPNNSIKVPSIDFADFIEDNFNKEDEIWLKLNVEGAEYEIIPHLKERGLLDWFNRTFIRWHSGKIPSLQENDLEIRDMVPNNEGLWRKKQMLPFVKEVPE